MRLYPIGAPGGDGFGDGRKWSYGDFSGWGEDNGFGDGGGGYGYGQIWGGGWNALCTRCEATECYDAENIF
jgi:hypothetical protein